MSDDLKPINFSDRRPDHPNVSIKGGYLQSYHCWLRIIIIVMLFAAWVSVTTIPHTNDKSFNICTYPNPSEGINPFNALRGGFLGLTISGWLLSIIFLIFEFACSNSSIPHRKIATIFDFLYIFVMMAVVIEGLMSMIDTMSCEFIKLGAPQAFAIGSAFAFFSMVLYIVIVFAANGWTCSCCTKKEHSKYV